jgi:hypothetical protein
MGYLCPGCKWTFSELKGLSIHKRYCKDLPGLVSWIKHDNDNNKGSSNPKRARDHGYSVDPEDDMLVDEHASDLDDNMELELLLESLSVPQAPPSPVSVSFSGRKQKVPHALKDYVPHFLAGLPPHLHPAVPAPPNPMPAAISAPSPLPPPDPAPEPDILRTDPNGFGLH